MLSSAMLVRVRKTHHTLLVSENLMLFDVERREVFDVQARGSTFVLEGRLRCGFCGFCKIFWWGCLRQMTFLKCWEDEHCLSERLGISICPNHVNPDTHDGLNVSTVRLKDFGSWFSHV